MLPNLFRDRPRGLLVRLRKCPLRQNAVWVTVSTVTKRLGATALSFRGAFSASGQFRLRTFACAMCLLRGPSEKHVGMFNSSAAFFALLARSGEMASIRVVRGFTARWAPSVSAPRARQAQRPPLLPHSVFGAARPETDPRAARSARPASRSSPAAPCARRIA